MNNLKKSMGDYLNIDRCDLVELVPEQRQLDNTLIMIYES